MCICGEVHVKTKSIKKNGLASVEVEPDLCNRDRENKAKSSNPSRRGPVHLCAGSIQGPICSFGGEFMNLRKFILQKIEMYRKNGDSIRAERLEEALHGANWPTDLREGEQ